MISPFLAPHSLPSFLSEYTVLTVWWRSRDGSLKKYVYILWNPGKATTALATNLHGQVPQILFIAQLTLSPPAFYIYRRLGAADLQLNFPLEAFFIAWCSPVVACFLRLPYAKRRLGAAVLQVQCLSFILLFSSFVPFRRYAPSSPIVHIRLEIWKEVVFSFVAFLRSALVNIRRRALLSSVGFRKRMTSRSPRGSSCGSCKLRFDRPNLRSGSIFVSLYK